MLVITRLGISWSASTLEIQIHDKYDPKPVSGSNTAAQGWQKSWTFLYIQAPSLLDMHPSICKLSTSPTKPKGP